MSYHKIKVCWSKRLFFFTLRTLINGGNNKISAKVQGKRDEWLNSQTRSIEAFFVRSKHR